MEELGQVIVNGIILAGTYALMGVGMTLIFGLMDLVNFAHGEFYMLGAYFVFTTTALLGLPFWLGFPLGILAVMVFAYGVDIVLFRPLRNRDILIRMVTTIGLMLVLQNAALLIWGPVEKRLPIPISTDSWSIAGIYVAPIHLLATALAIALILGLHLYFKKTKEGIALRACFQDQETAQLMGVNVDRAYGLTFAIGAGLAAAGGAILSMVFFMTPSMGDLATPKAFTIVILGGVGSLPGAIAGAIVVGLSESLAATYIAVGYKDAIAFVLLLALLFFRPQGLFGRSESVES
ncbi:MAG: branched-chain amino acid ABC transporter permease [Elainellaceae cyanobacterium]